MLEISTNFICALILSFFGYSFIKQIIKENRKLKIHDFLILIINSILIVLIHHMNYTFCSAVIVYAVNTVTYKYIFRKTYSESIIYTGILTATLFVAELIWSLIYVNFFTVGQVVDNSIIYLFSNILVVLTSSLIIEISKLREKLYLIYNELIFNEKVMNIIFISTVIFCLSALMYNIFFDFHQNGIFLSNIIIIIATITIMLLYVKNKSEYIKLMNEYDNLSVYVQNFEEWIEKEQFIRHEYKNQLAVIYALSNEKSVKEKIDEIIDNSINLEDKLVHSLKVLPKGGLKGLMYYKTTIAQKNKLSITIDVSIKDNGILYNLNKKRINELTKILGIYYDNAIEAARESQKKSILIEIYELKNKVNFVISNTYKQKNLIKNRNAKGISSKGEGRGNGLYFASKILNKNKSWMSEKQEIIDKYYIETLTAYKNTSRK